MGPHISRLRALLRVQGGEGGTPAKCAVISGVCRVGSGGRVIALSEPP